MNSRQVDCLTSAKWKVFDIPVVAINPDNRQNAAMGRAIIDFIVWRRY